MKSGEHSLPRLLVVTDFSPTPISGGALIRQMLTGYPAGQLHWWTCASQPFRDAFVHPARLHWFPVPPRLRPYRRLVGLKCRLLESLWVSRAAKNLHQTMIEQRIEAVWMHLSDWVIPVAWRVGIGSLPHSLVSIWDYPDSAAQVRQYTIRRARRFSHWVESLCRQAGHYAVISEAMRADLAARTGRHDGILFHSGLEPVQLKAIREDVSQDSDEIRIAYAGTIIVPEVFQLFLRALDRIRRDLPRPLKLHLFSQNFRGQTWFDPEWMCDHGFLDEPAFLERLGRCTWGFSPMNLRDDDDQAYRRYSFPNKIGTYLAAGLPLIVLAHRDSSASVMFEKYPIGICSDTTDPDVLADLLRRALSEPNPKTRFRSEMLRCAESEFDASEMRRRLWNCLRRDAE